VNTRSVVLAAALVACLVPAAHAARASSRTTAPPPVVDIKVKISDAGIVFSPKKAVRGAYGRFILLNVGKKSHSISLGAAKRGAGVQTGFHKFLKPSEQKVLLLFLDYRGPVYYRATLPSDRGKPRMKGVFRIT
jgi:hypothetical protein